MSSRTFASESNDLVCTHLISLSQITNLKEHWKFSSLALLSQRRDCAFVNFHWPKILCWVGALEPLLMFSLTLCFDYTCLCGHKSKCWSEPGLPKQWRICVKFYCIQGDDRCFPLQPAPKRVQLGLGSTRASHLALKTSEGVGLTFALAFLD